MSQMTEDKKRAFVQEILTISVQNTKLLAGKGFDVTSTTTEIEGLAHKADHAEAYQKTAQIEAERSTTDAVATLTAAYKKASDTVELYAGLLGKDHPLVQKLRKLRDF